MHNKFLKNSKFILRTVLGDYPQMAGRRVVVTGLGVVSPLGIGTKITWERLLQGACGIKRVEFDASYADQLSCKVGATVDEEAFTTAAKDTLDNSKAQSARFIAMAMIAAKEAISDAKLTQFDPTRAGVAIGSGIGSAVDEVAVSIEQTSRGLRRLSPYFVPRLLLNLAAGHVSIAHNLQGPNHACSTACATGAHAIGDASRFIQFGDADIMIAGGSESTVNALSFAGFSRIKALSTHEDPLTASRPFDKDRNGFVMGEGAGIVVLEELEHAIRRGASIYAELTGYGLSGDAFHLTAPSEDGRGALSAMKSAIRSGKANIDDIDYINAHATSTPLGDAIEARAISQLFQDAQATTRPSVSSTKGAIGHLLGAAGAVEAIFSILSVHNDVIPQTLNLVNTDIDSQVLKGFDYVANEPRRKQVRAALSNSFGFGGTNASLLFSKYSL